MLRYSVLCVSAEFRNSSQERCKKKYWIFDWSMSGVFWCDRVGVLTFELLYIDNLTFINLFLCAKNKTSTTFNHCYECVGVIPIKLLCGGSWFWVSIETMTFLWRFGDRTTCVLSKCKTWMNNDFAIRSIAFKRWDLVGKITRFSSCRRYIDLNV